MRCASAILLCCAAVGPGACGRDGATPRDPGSLIAIAPAADANAPPPSPSATAASRARGEVIVSFLDDRGGYWGPWGDPTTDAAAAVLPCYKRALADDPALVGWLRVRVPAAMGTDTPFGGSLVDSSGLPEALTACVVAKLASLRPRLGTSMPERIAYIVFGEPSRPHLRRQHMPICASLGRLLYDRATSCSCSLRATSRCGASDPAAAAKSGRCATG